MLQAHLLQVRFSDVSSALGIPIVPILTTRSSLLHNHALALQVNNSNKALSLAQHIAIAEAHPALNFPLTSINLPSSILSYAETAGTGPAPSEPFEEWLTRAWSTPQPTPAPTSARASANTSGKRSSKSSRSGSSQKSKKPTPLGEDPRR